MKRILKTTLCIILSVVFLSFSGCKLVDKIVKSIEDMIGKALFSCIPKEGPVLYYGDFEYCYVDSASDNRRSQQGDYVAILGLTKEGMQKETIIIPETIENKPVILIGMLGIGWVKCISEYGNYNKLYISTKIEQIRDSYDCEFAKKVFLLNEPNELFFQNIYGIFYVQKNDFEKYQKYIDNVDGLYKATTIYIANLTFIVDGNVYWIDDYENGECVNFPENPIKEGYTFDGWYKDMQYSTLWDEKTDKYLKPENEETVYLYAKWIKN